MTWVLFLIGLLIALKGLVCLVSPKKSKELLMKLWRLDSVSMRLIGLVVLIIGLYLIYISDFSSLAVKLTFG